LKIINDNQLRDRYYEERGIQKYFTDDMMSSLTLIRFNKSELICNEGDNLENIYFIVDGKAKVFKTEENGKSLLLCLYRDFGLIGGMEYLSKSTCAGSIQAITETYCLCMDLSTITRCFDEDIRFVREIGTILAKSLARNAQNSSFNLLYPLENRLATYIYVSNEHNLFKENMTLLAELLGTSYRHLHRILVKFCDIGLLSKKGRNYEILDVKRLERMANQTINVFY